jgi:hypothetical protein
MLVLRRSEGRRAVALALALVLPLALVSRPASAQDTRGEVVTDAPSYQGESASAPIPPRLHVRNERGAPTVLSPLGDGLCVIASVVANGSYQGIGDLATPDADGHAGHGSKLWRAAKARPGGYGPAKLQTLVDAVLPGETYASYVGSDPGILDRLSRAGYPIGATMSTGQLYGYAPIHHMISLIHYRNDGWACVVDNNDPGKYHWMPAREYARRWIDGDTGWAWIWTRRPADGSVPLAVALAVGSALALRRLRTAA